MLELKRESFAEFRPFAERLLIQHWLETAQKHRQLKPNWPLIEQLMNANVLRVTTARVDGELVGYIGWNLCPTMDCIGETVAQMGPWFVEKSQREGSLGFKLFKKSVAELVAEGINQLYPHYWLTRPETKTVGAWLERCGAEPVEMVYSLKAEDFDGLH